MLGVILLRVIGLATCNPLNPIKIILRLRSDLNASLCGMSITKAAIDCVERRELTWMMKNIHLTSHRPFIMLVLSLDATHPNLQLNVPHPPKICEKKRRVRQAGALDLRRFA